jgi:alanine dehydrogenase
MNLLGSFVEDHRERKGSAVPDVLFLSGGEIEGLLSMREAIELVEGAFRQHGEGKTIMPPKVYLNLPEYEGDFRAMLGYVDGMAGIKWVSVYPNNRMRNLPRVVATIILCESKTGYPLAVMGGTYLTAIRTGAAGGIAVRHLARKDSTTVGMIGAGA